MIAAGHQPNHVWSMTLKQLEAMAFVSRKRMNQQRVEELHVAQLAAHGDKKDVDKFKRDMSA